MFSVFELYCNIDLHSINKNDTNISMYIKKVLDKLFIMKLSDNCNKTLASLSFFYHLLYYKTLSHLSLYNK